MPRPAERLVGFGRSSSEEEDELSSEVLSSTLQIGAFEAGKFVARRVTLGVVADTRGAGTGRSVCHNFAMDGRTPSRGEKGAAFVEEAVVTLSDNDRGRLAGSSREFAVILK